MVIPPFPKGGQGGILNKPINIKNKSGRDIPLRGYQLSPGRSTYEQESQGKWLNQLE